MFDDEEFISAVRSHPLIGIGSGSPIEEYFTDGQIIEMFTYACPYSEQRQRIRSLNDALDKAIVCHHTMSAHNQGR